MGQVSAADSVPFLTHLVGMVICAMFSEVTAVAVTLVDVASGRVIKKFLHDWATYPVHAVIIENFVVTTYWNSKVR